MTSAVASSTPKLLIRRATLMAGTTRELINQRHQPKLATIVSLNFHEVIGPDIIAPFRP